MIKDIYGNQVFNISGVIPFSEKSLIGIEAIFSDCGRYKKRLKIKIMDLI